MLDNSRSREKLAEEVLALRERLAQLEALAAEQASQMQLIERLCRPIDLLEALRNLYSHDHIGAICESQQEWRRNIVAFIAGGIRRGEKCINIGDLDSAYRLRRYLYEDGIDVPAAENRGQLSALCGVEAACKGTLSSDDIVALLEKESKNALAEGYPAIRISTQMSSTLCRHPGFGKAADHEERLNKHIVTQYPCITLCQYDRQELTPEIVRAIVTTHPFLVRKNRLHRNFYFQEPPLSPYEPGMEVQQWLHNIDRESRIEEAIRRLAYHDPLTGLPNRLLFTEYLNRALELAHYYHRTIALLLIDLDRLKAINDTLGHKMGDQVLKCVAIRLKSILRENDLVGRFGGDEFLLLLAEITPEAVLTVAKRIQGAFERPFIIDSHELKLTASIGVALFPEHGRDAETLLMNADMAMYHVKDEGGNGYRVLPGQERL